MPAGRGGCKASGVKRGSGVDAGSPAQLAASQHGRPVEPARADTPDERPRLVFFASPNSGAAKRVEGFLAQVLQARRNHETFRIVRVDAQERPDLVERFRITSLPALAVVEGKRVSRRLEKPRGCADIRSALGPWLH